MIKIENFCKTVRVNTKASFVCLFPHNGGGSQLNLYQIRICTFISYLYFIRHAKKFKDKEQSQGPEGVLQLLTDKSKLLPTVILQLSHLIIDNLKERLFLITEKKSSDKIYNNPEI